MIENFKFWCQKVLPLVYDNSLSYYEVLCKAVNKLNETIDAQNALSDDFANLKETLETEIETFEGNINTLVNDFTDSITKKVEEIDETVTSEVAKMETFIVTLQSEYTQFKSDINSEITTFESTVNSKISTFETTVNKEISTFESTVNNQITTFENTVNTNFSTLESNLKGEISALETTLQGNIDTSVSILQTTINSAVAEMKSQITSEISSIDTEFETLETSLKSEVTTYLQNYDYTTDINNKIQSLYDDGSLNTGNLLNVKYVGAVGDGVTDDTEAIQKAINQSATGYGGIYFPPGTYIITSTITVPYAKGTMQFNGAVLKFVGDMSEHALSFTSVHGWVIRNATFAVNISDTTPDFIYQSTTDLRLIDCTLDSSFTCGLINTSSYCYIDNLVSRNTDCNRNKITVTGAGRVVITNSALSGGITTGVSTRCYVNNTYMTGVITNGGDFYLSNSTIANATAITDHVLIYQNYIMVINNVRLVGTSCTFVKTNTTYGTLINNVSTNKVTSSNNVVVCEINNDNVTINNVNGDNSQGSTPFVFNGAYKNCNITNLTGFTDPVLDVSNLYGHDDYSNTLLLNKYGVDVKIDLMDYTNTIESLNMKYNSAYLMIKANGEIYLHLNCYWSLPTSLAFAYVLINDISTIIYNSDTNTRLMEMTPCLIYNGNYELARVYPIFSSTSASTSFIVDLYSLQSQGSGLINVNIPLTITSD